MRLEFCTKGILMVMILFGCGSGNGDTGTNGHIAGELTKINGLLRDTAFAAKMAMAQDAAYYENQGQTAASFFTGNDSLLNKSLREEKIAINLAGFYAVECGISALAALKAETPVFWLEQIITNKLDSNDVLLLNRFANATWKTGQPFRGMQRISRDNFIVANLLSEAEIKKDADQVLAAATLLLDSLKGFGNAGKAAQVERINQLLKDKQFALDMAQHMENAYYKGQNKPAPPFLTGTEDTATIKKSAREEKIATNLAGFYALECGVNYLVTLQHKPASAILQSISDNSISQQDKQLLERFANATWKAAQPFRGLDRITRNIFMPFELLPEAEVEKDWDQIKSAAAMLQKHL